jgi:cyclohexyl-isocyanide hydratase
MTRRELHAMLTAALCAVPQFLSPAKAQDRDQDKAPETAPRGLPDLEAMRRRDDQIVMLMYPQMTALDLVGPQYAFASTLGAKVHLVAKTMEPVMTDTGLAILPSATFADAPKTPTVLFVPGGTHGTLAAIEDRQTLAFVKAQGEAAQYVTSVCTGSLVLAAAGLLDGYRATCHWIARDLLALRGAIPVNERVVTDRNRITGAGVSAGIDFGLALVAQMRGEAYARNVQLIAEYAPDPPFASGTPEEAWPETTRFVSNLFEPFRKNATAALQER